MFNFLSFLMSLLHSIPFKPAIHFLTCITFDLISFSSVPLVSKITPKYLYFWQNSISLSLSNFKLLCLSPRHKYLFYSNSCPGTLQFPRWNLTIPIFSCDWAAASFKRQIMSSKMLIIFQKKKKNAPCNGFRTWDRQEWDQAIVVATKWTGLSFALIWRGREKKYELQHYLTTSRDSCFEVRPVNSVNFPSSHVAKKTGYNRMFVGTKWLAFKSSIWSLYLVYKRVKQSRYRPGQAQGLPGN